MSESTTTLVHQIQVVHESWQLSINLAWTAVAALAAVVVALYLDRRRRQQGP